MKTSADRNGVRPPTRFPRLRAMLAARFEVARFRGAPVFVHWSVVLAYPVAWTVDRSVANALVAATLWLALMLAHELGHAIVARRLGLRVAQIRINPAHGACVVEQPPTETAAIALAWGGVAAQAVVLYAAGIVNGVLRLSLDSTPQLLRIALCILIPVNLWIIFANLLPIPSLDGAVAWRFVPLVRARLAARRLARARAETVVDLGLRRIARRAKPRADAR